LADSDAIGQIASGSGAAPVSHARAAEVLGVISTLAEELHPHQKGRPSPGPTGDLDRDFGLDSLGRVEAIHRLEALFNTTLPEQLFAEAGTPLDLARAIEATGPTAGPPLATRSEDRAAPQAAAAPQQLRTLGEVLAWHAENQGGRAHIYLSDGETEAAPISYGQLHRSAARFAIGLVAKDVEPGERVALMLPTGEAFFTVFMGVILAGAVPAPIYPPWRLLRIEEHLRRQARILDKAGAAGLVTFEAALPFGRLVRDHAPTLRFVTTADVAAASPAPARQLHRQPDDLALLQFTSGSTADPKGVMLSHANILANVRALAQAIRATPSDVLVSWLPLYHDMGLIAAWLACLDQAVPFVAMSPLSFMARPERWLWTIHRNRATITAAPNFAYEQCLAIPDERVAGLDLSSLRVAGCGSEPISPRTLSDFTRRFAPYGFRADCLMPVYGLAESAAALTTSPLGRPPRIDRVDRGRLVTRARARVVGAGAPGAQEIVSCGAPLVGHEVRILDPGGQEAPEREEGRLQFRGPSATSGYFNDPEKTAELIVDGWLESGDLAYIAEGEIFITGRSKDVVKRAGRNIHPADVEAAISALPDVPPEGAVLFSATDPQRGTERLVLVVETTTPGEDARRRLTQACQELAADHLETSVDDIVVVAQGIIPRTESGKVRRSALRDAVLAGSLTEGRASPRQQILRLQLTAASGRFRRWRRTAVERLYATYWWTIVGMLGVVLWPTLMFLPTLRWRWAAVRKACRAALMLLGHRMTLTCEGPLLASYVVYVANHSSYLDSLVLTAVLPGPLAYPVFKELADRPIEGPFLRRLGALFVERFEPAGALAAAADVLAILRHGRPLVVFPEATIMRMPGLLDFRLGAFAAAAEASAPVIPVTVRGTRSILRHDHRWFPRRGSIDVHVGRAIQPSGPGFEAAVGLKNAARAAILAHVHEPDLAEEAPFF
jgi:1-acyl-sn-glycerol-3-phosphate acyltransferase